jgi:hypothetical protein
MVDLNIISILYIAYRLAPFILVSFFTISSIFNQDFKGLVYLCGLLITCFLCIITGNTFSGFFRNTSDDGGNDIFNQTTKVCNLLTLTKSGPISHLPLSMAVFCYTFGYLLFIIVKYNLVNQNLPTLIIFPLIITSDFFWNMNNKCSKVSAVIAAGIISGLVGVGWSYFINSTKITDLQYFNGLSNKEICSRPAKQSFKCVVKSTSTN